MPDPQNPLVYDWDAGTPTAPTPARPPKPRGWGDTLATLLRIGTGALGAKGGAVGALTGSIGESAAEIAENPKPIMEAIQHPINTITMQGDLPEGAVPADAPRGTFLGDFQNSLSVKSTDSPTNARIKGFMVGAAGPLLRHLTSAGITAAPISKTILPGRFLQSGARSGALAGVGEAGREVSAGEKLDPASIAGSTASGVVLGGAFGKLMGLTKGGKAAMAAEEEAARAAKAAKVSAGPAPILETTARTGTGTRTLAGGKINEAETAITGAKPAKDIKQPIGYNTPIKSPVRPAVPVGAPSAPTIPEALPPKPKMPYGPQDLHVRRAEVVDRVAAERAAKNAAQSELASNKAQEGVQAGRAKDLEDLDRVNQVGFERQAAAKAKEAERLALEQKFNDLKGDDPVTKAAKAAIRERLNRMGLARGETGVAKVAGTDPAIEDALAANAAGREVVPGEARQVGGQLVEGLKPEGPAKPVAPVPPPVKPPTVVPPKPVKPPVPVVEPAKPAPSGAVPENVPPSTPPPPSTSTTPSFTDAQIAMQERIKAAHAFAGGNRTRMAEWLGISRRGLFNVAQRAGIDLETLPSPKGQAIARNKGLAGTLGVKTAEAPANPAARAAAPAAAVPAPAAPDLTAPWAPDSHAFLTGIGAKAIPEDVSEVIKDPHTLAGIADTAGFDPKVTSALNVLGKVFRHPDTPPAAKAAIGQRLAQIDSAERARLGLPKYARRPKGTEVIPSEWGGAGAPPKSVGAGAASDFPSLESYGKEGTEGVKAAEGTGLFDRLKRLMSNEGSGPSSKVGKDLLSNGVPKGPSSPISDTRYDELRKMFGGLKGETGGVNPALMMSLGSGAAGAAIGGATDPLNNRVESAGAGFVLGAAAPHVIKGLANMGAPKDILARLAQKFDSGEATKDSIQEVIRALPQWQRASLLSSKTGVITNTAVAGYGSLFMQSLESMLEGDPRGTQLFKELVTPSGISKYIGSLKGNWGAAGEAIGRAEGDIQGPAKTFFERVTRLPGRAMTTFDMAGQDMMQRMGYNELEGRAATLTNEPASKTAQAISHFGKASGGKGLFAQLTLPFSRTMANYVEQGLKRIPLVGEAWQHLGMPEADAIRSRIAQQVLGGLSMVPAYEVGKHTTPEQYRTARRYMGNFGGKYGMPIEMAGAAGQVARMGGGIGAQLAGGAVTGARSAPLPSTRTIEELVNMGGQLMDTGTVKKELPSFIKPRMLTEAHEGAKWLNEKLFGIAKPNLVYDW